MYAMSSPIPKPEIILIIDLQSSAVRGTLVYCSEKSPYVLSTHKVLVTQRASETAALIQATLKGVQQVTEAAQKEIHTLLTLKEYQGLPRKISRIHFVMCAPWIVSQAKTVRKSAEKDFQVTKKYIFALIDKERSGFLPKANFPVTIVEEKISEVRLNGYAVSDWENKLCKELEISFIVSVAGETMVQSLSAVVAKHVPVRKHCFHSSLLLQTIGIHSNFENISSYVLIHIHGNFTDIAVVKELSCAYFGTCELGDNGILDDISKNANLDLRASASAMSLYGTAGLDEIHAKKDIKIVEESMLKWVKNVFEMLAKEYPAVMPLTMPITVSSLMSSAAYSAALRAKFPDLPVIELKKEEMSNDILFSAKAERLNINILEVSAIHSLGQE